MKTSPYDSITEIADKLDIDSDDRDNLKRIAMRCKSQLQEVESLKDSIIYRGVTDYKKSVIQKKIDKINRLL